MTPFEIEILLHYYYTDPDYADVLNPKRQAPIFNETMKKLTKLGFFIEHHYPNLHYEANKEPLKLYVEALMKVPAPILKWTMPDAN